MSSSSLNSRSCSRSNSVGDSQCVLITGFEPFGTHAINPSWEIANKLDGKTVSGSATQTAHKKARGTHTPMTYTIRSVLLPVVYSKVPEIMDDLLQDSNISLVVHCGVGLPGSFRMEERARNRDYTKIDNDGESPHDNRCGEGPDELSTKIDLQRVLSRVSDASGIQVNKSTDAGLYLCEYTYYNTMNKSEVPAVFIHIPPIEKPYTLQEMETKIEQIVQALVDEVVSTRQIIPHKDASWVSHFQKIRDENPDMATAACAMRTLIDYIRKTDAATLTGLREGIKSVMDALTGSMDSKITSVSSGCELFLRFITLKAEYSKDFDECKRQLVDTGTQYLRKADLGRGKIAKKGLSFIRDGAIVLAHAYSRTIVAVLQEAARAKRRFTVYVTESKPSSQGLKTAARLQEHGIPVTVIPDAAVGYVMESVDLVLVGAEAIVESGGIINTIGTYQIALVAKASNTPFYVAGESFKFVRLFPLNQSEIPAQRCTALPSLPLGLTSLNPLMDYTPPSYITLLFTDLGLLTPSAVSDELIKLYL
eukprot:m.337393 g.337393  ORF g.337393 m.337393 type:complete len:536 (+) comp18116_c0_seq1:105-1712(+)